MVLMSLFPKIWFKVMNPRIISYRKFKAILPEDEVKTQEECKKFIYSLACCLTSLALLGIVY